MKAALRLSRPLLSVVSIFPHRDKTTPANTIAIAISTLGEAMFPILVNGTGELVLVALKLPLPEVLFVPPTKFPRRVKLAQVIRVVFAKWTVKERFPKNDPKPSCVEAKSSEKDAWNGSEIMAPYFPARSLTWQVWGRFRSQPGVLDSVGLHSTRGY
jgi:hypothetical protein